MHEIIEKIKSMGADNVGVISTDKIPFEPSLITLCELNTCGNYGKNWTCPPLVGDTEKLIKKAKSYDNIIVFQTVYKLEDSFDIEGMGEGNRAFRELTDNIAEFCRETLNNVLILSAGGCKVCERCAAADKLPCVNPDKALASLEAYGIQVSTLAEVCGMKYINGQNTVTYFGGILI